MMPKAADLDSSAIEESWARLLTDSVPSDKRRVLEAICDRDDLDGFEFTDLHLAVLGLSQSTVEAEIKRLVRRTDATIDDLDIHGRSAVSWAAQRGDAPNLRLVLEHGAESSSHKGSKSPLSWAAGMSESAECVSLLLKYGADAGVCDISGLNALMWACVNFRGCFDAVSLLLPVADLEHTDINDRTAIFHAASTNLIPTELLIQSGANINHRDQHGFSALHLAILNNQPEIFLALHAAGADYRTMRGNKQTLLHHAAQSGSMETLNAMLLSQLRGLNVDVQDDEECTAMDRFLLRVPPATDETKSAFERLLLQIRNLPATRSGRSDHYSPESSVSAQTCYTAHESGQSSPASISSSPSHWKAEDSVTGFAVDIDVEPHEST